MAISPRVIDVTVVAGAVILAAAVMVPIAAPQDEAPRQVEPVAVEQPALAAAAAADQPAGRTGGRPPVLGRREHGPRRDLSPELVEEYLRVARDVDPELAERLEEIRREQSAEDFARAIGKARHLGHLVGLRREDPKLYDVKVQELRLDAQVDRLLEQVAEARRTRSGSQAALEAQLRGLVQQQVGYSLAARGMYLRRLNDHVRALRDQLDRDLGDFQRAVDRRMKHLLEEAGTAPGSAADLSAD
jgi:hypothetical protein